MEINISIGDRLREEREATGKTQSDLAAVAAAWGVPGATRQSQAKYEKGLASPSAAYLAAIESAGIDVFYVLTGKSSKGKVPEFDSAEQVLLESYRRCKPDAKANLIQTAALLSAGLTPLPAQGNSMVMSNLGNGNVQVGAGGHASVKKSK